MMYERPGGMSDEEDDEYGGFEFSSEHDDEVYNRRYYEEVEYVESPEDKFYSAVKDGEVDQARSILQSGLHVDQPLCGEWSALMHACSFGAFPMVEFLVNEGANVNFNKDLFTPLMALCKCTSVKEEELLKCFDVLMSHGADGGTLDRHANSALMYACGSGHLELVKKLVDAGVDLNVQDIEGWNSLFHAVNRGSEDIVQILLNAKARLDVIDRRRRTAFQLALEKGYDHIAKLVCSKKERRRLQVNEDVEYPVNKFEKDPIDDLLDQLPNVDAKSNSGFSSDVNKLLWAMHVGHLSKKFSSKNVQLNELLLITDNRLKELGVRFSVHRERILTSVKKFHLHPWNKASLGLKPRNVQMTVEDGITLMCNVTKHLHVISATMNYLRLHQPIPIEPEVFDLCDKAVHQLNLINGELKAIENYCLNLEKREKIEPVDLIKPKKKSRSYLVPIVLTTVFFSFMVWKKEIYINKKSFLNIYL